MLAAERRATFRKDRSLAEARIGVKEFRCAGELPLQDHPHVCLDMGTGDTIQYLSYVTRFRYDPRPGSNEAEPPDCAFVKTGPMWRLLGYTCDKGPVRHAIRLWRFKRSWRPEHPPRTSRSKLCAGFSKRYSV